MAGEIPSRLANRASGGGPLRGVGAGFAENQKMVGAQNPEVAAKLAAASPEDVQAAMEEQEAAAQEIETKRSELLEALNSGAWTAPQPLPPGSTWEKLLSKQTAQFINSWYQKFQEFRNTVVEKEDDEQLKDSIRASLDVAPDDPLYDPMVDKARRKKIESNLKPLDFETMVFQGYVEQEIPLHQSLSITLRTLTTHQGLWVEYHISKFQDLSTQSLRHTFSLLQVAVSLERINGKPMSPSLDKFVRQDQRDEFIKALEQRMDKLSQMPSLLTDDFIIQYVWFTGRVRKLLSGNMLEQVGNS